MQLNLALAAALCGAVLSARAGEVLVFNQPGTPVGTAFEQLLPSLESLSRARGHTLRVIDAGAKPVPEAVTITPLIVYQDHRGRSIYQGRWNTLPRIENFLATAERFPQEAAPLIREGVGALRLGSATIAFPLKVTPPTGDVPASIDAWLVALPELPGKVQPRIGEQALQVPSFPTRVALGRADRSFYVDVHPFFAADGHVFLSAEVYSQFDCHTPVWSILDRPVSGRPQEASSELFRQVAAAVYGVLNDAGSGDSFDPVPTPPPGSEGGGVLSRTFEALGFPLPEAPAEEAAADFTFVWPDAWSLDHGASTINFAFPAPLEAYAGSAAAAGGALTLSERGGLEGATGRVAADPTTVTMGAAALDAAVRDSMIRVDEFPEAAFVLDRIEATDAAQPSLEPGRLVPVLWHGHFTMKGVTIPLSLPVQMEAGADANGVLVRASAAWELPLTAAFDIDGPPGPEEAASRLRFAGEFVFRPAR